MLASNRDEGISFPMSGEGIARNGDAVMNSIRLYVIAEVVIFVAKILIGLLKFRFKRCTAIIFSLRSGLNG